MKLISQTQSDIHVKQMLDGQIAVIINWSYREYIGRIVQRFGNHLINLGHTESNSWPELFLPDSQLPKTCRVFILPPGTKLEI